jgi:rhodanese-related sulfurtransferase
MPIQSLNNQALNQLLQNHPELPLIDVRTEQEYTQLGHLTGAKLVPLQTLAERVGELEPLKEQPVLVYCQHGVRSMHACGYLEQMGFTQLYNLAEGFVGWDGPIEKP